MNLLIRRLLKIPLALGSLARPTSRPGVTYLIYHSVSPRLRLELALPYPTFQRQLEFLAQTGRVIPYDQALACLQAGQPLARDAFVLTFDDGFVDFYTTVFPLLRRLQLPAILFVNTGFVDSGRPYPLLPRRDLPVEPLSWQMLDKMAASGLVTLGAHTHTHPELVTISLDQVEEELQKPVQLLKQRLGLKVKHFAYPRALWNEAVEQLVRQTYQSAVIGGGHKASPDHFHPYRIPRLPIRRSDGWLFFRAKVRGWLANEERFYQVIKQFTTNGTGN